MYATWQVPNDVDTQPVIVIQEMEICFSVSDSLRAACARRPSLSLEETLIILQGVDYSHHLLVEGDSSSNRSLVTAFVYSTTIRK